MTKVIVRDIARGRTLAEFVPAPAHVAIIHIEKRNDGTTVLHIPTDVPPVILDFHVTIEVHNLGD